MPQYPGFADRQDYLRRALDDASVPQVLKALYERIIPDKDIDAFRRLVESGSISPRMDAGNQPLLSPVAQVLAMGAEGRDWLAALFARDPAALIDVRVSGWGFRWGDFKSSLREYGGHDLETPLLLSVLAARPEPVLDIASVYFPAIFQRVADRNGQTGEDSVLHAALQSRQFTTSMLDRLEQLSGNADFLSARNGRGETLFHRIAAHAAWGDNEEKVDLASWMLQRNPLLVNEPDRFGWTPLDRLLARSQGNVDTAMGRLLLASGARLEKQIAPRFNLASALRDADEKRLEKPAVRRLPPPASPA